MRNFEKEEDNLESPLLWKLYKSEIENFPNLALLNEDFSNLGNENIREELRESIKYFSKGDYQTSVEKLRGVIEKLNEIEKYNDSDLIDLIKINFKDGNGQKSLNILTEGGKKNLSNLGEWSLTSDFIHKKKLNPDGTVNLNYIKANENYSIFIFYRVYSYIIFILKSLKEEE